MRKTILFAVACAAACACSGEKLVSPDSMNDGIVRLVANAPASKVSVENTGKAFWSAGDKIAVYDEDGTKHLFTLESGAGEARATFTCSDFEGKTADIAVYPYMFAGDTPGSIVVPGNFPLSESAPMFLAAKVDDGNMYFKHIGGMIEFTFEDIPAYACGLKVWTNSYCISGEMYFDADELGPVVPQAASSTETVKDMYIITFPYKTGYGNGTKTKFFAPLPVADYSDLKLRFVDGDGDVIEGSAMTVPAASSNIAVADYIAMPSVNLRNKVTRPDTYRKVEGVLWASGNLRVDENGTDGEGWQTGWNVYANQWESVPSMTNSNLDGESLDYTLPKNGDGVNNNWDIFNWGGISRSSRVHNAGFMVPTTEKFDISGRIFSERNGSKDFLDTSELSGDNRWADIGSFQGSQSTVFGDIAFWASKGQMRMPTSGEIVKLRGLDPSHAKYVKTNANMQAGYYIDSKGNKLQGLLFTSSPSWADATYNVTPIEFTDADMESGLFLPKAGRRFGTTATAIKYFNNQGVYWSSTFGALQPNYETCATVLGFKKAFTTEYGYTVNLNSSNWGDTKCGALIRPVVIK